MGRSSVIAVLCLFFLIWTPLQEVKGEEERPVVGLVLSGGSAWGLAHIGVIEVLEENNIPVDLVAGASAGGIVGALWASGLNASELTEVAAGIRIIDFMIPAVPDLGFFSTRGIQEEIGQFIDYENIEDLPMPFATLATDLDRGEKVVFDKGPIKTAVAATAAIPVVFKPVEYNGKILADGGLVDNLPVGLAREMGADIIIAVNLSVNFSFEGRPQGLIETGIRAFNILQKHHGGTADAEIVIEPDLVGLPGTDYSEYREFIERGRAATEKALPEILKALEQQ